MKIDILRVDKRGIMDNREFSGYAVFSNGQPESGRPDAYGTVYVFNDDSLYPKSRLGMHPHANVEIVTMMISGEESHKDIWGSMKIMRQEMYS